LDVDAELVAASSALSMLNDARAWISVLNCCASKTTNADIDEVCTVKKHGVDD
jgi:hypothetical protein